MLSAAGGSREHPAPEIALLPPLTGSFTDGRAAGMPGRAYSGLWSGQSWGQELGCLVGGGPHCQVILQKLSSGFWTKKQNPNMLEPDDPGNHPAQPLPKCPRMVNPPRCSMKKKKVLRQRRFRKSKL